MLVLLRTRFAYPPPRPVSLLVRMNSTATAAAAPPPRAVRALPPGVGAFDIAVPSLLDGWALGAKLFTPPPEAVAASGAAADGIKGAVCIAPATGVPGKFYGAFAAALAAAGHTVITFDMRMNGASYPAPDAPEQIPSKPHDSQKLSDEARISCLRAWQNVGWTQYAADVASAMLRVAQEAPHAPLYFLGNSLGAHMLPPALAYLRSAMQPGAAEAAQRLRRALFVGGNSPHFGYNDDPSATVRVYQAMLDDVVPEGYGATSRMGLGLDIPRRALEDWITNAVHPNYIGAVPAHQPAFEAYDIDTLHVVFSDDNLAVGPRKIDAYARILGYPTNMESTDELAYWQGQGEKPDFSGASAFARGDPPDASDTGRQLNAFINTRLHVDVWANGWVQGSPSSSSATADPRPRVVGHVDFVRAAVGAPASKSAESWALLRAWLEHGTVPQGHDEVLQGNGRRRDFGAAPPAPGQASGARATRRSKL